MPLVKPPKFVKSGNDRKAWETAKTAGRRYAERHPVQNLWGLINHIFKKITRRGTLTEDVTTYIDNDYKESVYEAIYKRINENELFSDLSEQYRYGMIESIFEDYISKHTEFKEDVLTEFVNTYNTSGIGGMRGTGLSGGGLANISTPYSPGIGVGGYRDEKPIGPIIYGMDDRTLNFKNSNDPPAVVNIKHDKVPFPKDLENDDEETPFKNATIEDEYYFGELGNTIDSLESIGVDLDELNDMSNEEIEDYITDKIKQVEKEENYKNRLNTPIDTNSSNVSKIQESFLHEDVLDEARRRRGPILQARELLAKKFQYKKANKKDVRGRYEMNRYKIEKLMKHYGYKFNSEKYRWLRNPVNTANKPGKPYTAPKYDSEPQVFKTPKYEPIKPVDSSKKIEDDEPTKPKKHESEKEEPKVIDKEHILHPATKTKIKDYQGRFLLGFAHSMIDATQFKQDPQTQEIVPVISAEEVKSKLENMKYEWDDDKMIWQDENLSYPNIIFETHEARKTLIARAYLASQGMLNAISAHDRGVAEIPVEQIESIMESKGFTFNNKLNHWERKEEKEVLKESMLLQEAYYNGTKSLENQAKFIFTPIFVEASKGMKSSKSGSPVTVSEIKTAYEDKFGFKAGQEPNISLIEKFLTALGYTPDDTKSPNPIWRKNGKVAINGEDEESLSARGLLSTLDSKNSPYITQRIDFNQKNVDDVIKSISPMEKPSAAKEQISQNYTWENGWIPTKEKQKQEIAKQKAEKDKIEAEKKSKTDAETKAEADKENIIKKLNTPHGWSNASWAERERGKELSAGKMLGFSPNQWDNLKNTDRTHRIRQLNRTHKFTIDKENGKISWEKRKYPLTFGGSLKRLVPVLKFLGNKTKWLGRTIKKTYQST